MENEPFVIERTYNAPVERVWQGITDKDAMKQWYFDLGEFKPVVGFEFRFEGGSKERRYLHICIITEVIINRKLKHSWCYDGYEGESFVTWELFEEEAKTKVRLTHEGLHTFPRDNKDFGVESFTKGWTHIVGKSLAEFVEKPL